MEQAETREQVPSTFEGKRVDTPRSAAERNHGDTKKDRQEITSKREPNFTDVKAYVTRAGQKTTEKCHSKVQSIILIPQVGRTVSDEVQQHCTCSHHSS